MSYKTIPDMLLKMGAERRELTFQCGDTMRTVNAVVLPKIDSRQADAFQDKHLRFLKDEKAILVKHLHTLRAFTVEELDSLPMDEIRRLNRSISALWLMGDDSLEFQIHVLELCKYSDGSAEHDARLSEAKKLMREIFALEPFKIRLVGEGYVGFDFVSQAPLKKIDEVWPKVADFLRRYGQPECATKGWLSHVKKNRCLHL